MTAVNCKAEFKLGETTAIYGKSGVGKTTVLRIIAGLEKAEKGIIRLNNEVWYDSIKKVNLPIAKRNIGFVFQDFNLFPNMTVKQNLNYASSFGITAEIEALLEVTGLTKLLASYPKELSGGEKQRVSIMRALCQNPKLLLLDEPFSALDDDVIGDIIKELKLIQQQTGTTIILVSHRKDIIFEMAQNLVIMKTDESIIQGSPKNLLTRRF